MAVIIDGTSGVATPGVTDTGNLSVAGTTTLTTPLPVASGGTGATSLSGITVGVATSASNLLGGAAGTVPYQTSSGVTAMLAAGSSGQFLQSTGSSAPIWATLTTATNITRTAKTSGYTLQSSDKGNLIACTSGTFTLSFTAAATLASGWCVYIQNSGTGDITLDPNGSETIDGLTSYIMYPGESRLVLCDGSAFYSLIITGFSRTFTSTSTFTTPPGYKRFTGLMWAGGGGGRGGTNAQGGGGGACNPFLLESSAFSATETFTVGAGGAGGNGASGSAGGTSSIGTKAYAYGGGPGGSAQAGGGGGIYSAGDTVGTPGSPGVANDGRWSNASATYQISIPHPFGGAMGPGGSTAASLVSGGGAYGGGAGQAAGTDSDNKKSVFGGAGGGSNNGGSGAAGTSLYGGNGGAASAAGQGSDGSTPGGGGGAGGTIGGAGGRGEIRIWGIF